MKFWKKRSVDTNPRGKRYRGDPVWMLNLVEWLRVVNALMLSLVIVGLMLLWMINQ